ncbi:MAG: ABC transporter ATP-binding protein/permease [Eubacterium sp.]|nr:ABC transporter ATP-binding protein/permease [Eubacterium sp.]
MIAVYLILEPIVTNGKEALDKETCWTMVIVLAVHTLIYALIRRKSYLDICVGHSKASMDDKIGVAEHLKGLSMGYFASHDAGDLSTLLSRGYEEIENTSSMLVANASVIGLRLILAMIVLFIFDYRMALAVFSVIPLAIPFAVLSYKRVGSSGGALIETQRKTASEIIEYVGGIGVLQAYNQAGDKFSSLQDTFARLRDDSKRQEKAGGPVSMFARAILYCGIGIVIAYGTHLFVEGEISAFFFIMCLLASLQVYEPILQLFVLIVSMARTNQFVGKLAELKGEKPLVTEKPIEIPGGNRISFENVTFGYGDNEVLRDITFDIPEGSFTALVGPSGSGKSTITRLICRFWDVEKGTIKIGGVPIKRIPDEKLLEKISMVFQDVYLFHDTIEENIKMGRQGASHQEIVEVAKKAGCHDFIMEMPEGYNTVIGEGGSTLSGGEKQRISIARAILSDAPIVLLDEATASLDPQNEVLIQRAIDELTRNRTVVVIAHRLQSIMNVDNILVLKDGGIAESGSHSELLSQNGIYKNLWDNQSKAGNWTL